MTTQNEPQGAGKGSTGKHRDWRRKAIWTGAAVVAFGIVGYFGVPPLAKSILVDKASAKLHRPVSIGSIGFNPYTLEVDVGDFKIGEAGGAGEFVAFSHLYADLALSSVFRGGPVVNEIRLDSPRVHLVRNPDGRYNFSDILDEILKQPDSPTPKFSLNNIQVNDGRVDFVDTPLKRTHTVSDIRVRLPFVSSLPSYTDSFIEPAFAAKVDGAPLTLEGKSKPFKDSHESELALDLDDFDLTRIVDYSPVPLPAKLVSGFVDTRVKAVFREERGKPGTLSLAGNVILKKFALAEPGGAPLAGVERAELVIDGADLVHRDVRLTRIALQAPQVHARLDKGGNLNWLALLPKAAKEPVAAKKDDAGGVKWSLAEATVADGAFFWRQETGGAPFDARVDKIDVKAAKLGSAGEPIEFDAAWAVDAGEALGVERFEVKGGRVDLTKREAKLAEVRGSILRALVKRRPDGSVVWVEPPVIRGLPAAAPAAKGPAAAPWTVAVGKLAVTGEKLRFEDQALAQPAVQTIDALDLGVDNFSTARDAKAKVALKLKLNRRGEIAVDGSLAATPLAGDLKYEVKGVELLPLQPYFSERLNVTVTRGQVASQGTLALRPGKRGEIGGVFKGRATVGDFHSVDKLNAADLVKWKSLYVGNVEVRLNPLAVSVGEVAVSDFYARVIISPEGKLNLAQLVREKEKPAGAAAAAVPASTVPAAASASPSTAGTATAAPPMPLTIGKVTLQGGNVNFTDNFIKPNYSANLTGVGGRVTGLSSAADSIADLELRGSYDDSAPVSVVGKLNPLAAKPYLDIQAEVKGVELTPFSPYAGKYAGYAIEKGKLSLNVKYKVEDGKLTAENRVFLDQLTFGERVDSPDAVKLPVTLAVALLKNRRGEIDINLPISGSLDDPQFSVGGIIVQVILNLLGKAVTAPFALLGSLFGGGEELSYIEYDYGRDVLTAPARERLTNLAKALTDRPAIKLEIAGRVDPERDREGLKRAIVERKVKAQKLNDLVRKGIEAGSADDVTVDAKEYPGFLERAYKAEKFPKPRNIVGLLKDLPVEEMEKLMLANTQVSDDDLRQLAIERAERVRDWLVKTGEIPGERIFLLPPKVGAQGAKGDLKAKDSRADFSLK